MLKHASAQSTSTSPTLSEVLAYNRALREQNERILSEFSELKSEIKRISGAAPAGESSTALAIPRAPVRKDIDVVREMVKLHGRISTVELVGKTGWNKQRVWRQIDELEQAGEVHVMRGKRDPQTHRRGPDIVYHDTAIAI
jgi:hypothetical protein